MASSMWDSLLGGESPYPLRVGNYCFSKNAEGADAEAHVISEDKPCCKQCRNQPDFHGVGPNKFGEVLAEVVAAKGGGDPLTPNPNDINPALLEYFRSIPSAGAKTTEILEHLVTYIRLFVDPTDAKVSAAADALGAAADEVVQLAPKTVAGGAGLMGGGPTEDKALKDALDAFLDLVIAKVPSLRTPAQKYDAALKRKGTWLAADGTLAYAKADGTVTDDVTQRAKADCNSQSQRMKDLQAKLIEQLAKLEAEASKNEVDAMCGLACSEDVEMNRMLNMYEKLLKDAKTKSGAQSAGCDLTKFDDDETLKLLKNKLEQLERQSFAFLHAECEAVEQCAPHEDLIPTNLIDCSGLYESEILFNDTHMAAIGQYLAGAQRDGQSPGALGHASRLYKSGTIAPGVNPDELWINVCYRVAGTADDAIDTMWVRANVCDQRKYETLQAIRKAITEQKRAILALNREILDLQYQVSAGHGFGGGPAAFFSTARREGAVDDSVRTQMAIKSSVARAANSLRRNSDRRRKPQLLSADDGAYDYDDNGAQDPRFAQMMRKLRGVGGAR
jgi:hypothetical protein